MGPDEHQFVAKSVLIYIQKNTLIFNIIIRKVNISYDAFKSMFLSEFVSLELTSLIHQFHLHHFQGWPIECIENINIVLLLLLVIKIFYKIIWIVRAF